MKIYKLTTDVDRYQILLPKDLRVFQTDILNLDGTSKRGGWPTVFEAELDNKNALVPDVFSFGAGNLLVSGRSEILFREKLSCAEFLPVSWPQGAGSVVNVLGYCDCLDVGRTTWCVDEPSGKRLFIEEYQFLPEKVCSLDLVFKIKEECFELFCADAGEGAESLLSLVEKHNIKGFSFELVWTH